MTASLERIPSRVGTNVSRDLGRTFNPSNSIGIHQSVDNLTHVTRLDQVRVVSSYNSTLTKTRKIFLNITSFIYLFNEFFSLEFSLVCILNEETRVREREREKKVS